MLSPISISILLDLTSYWTQCQICVCEGLRWRCKRNVKYLGLSVGKWGTGTFGGKKFSARKKICCRLTSPAASPASAVIFFQSTSCNQRYNHIVQLYNSRIKQCKNARMAGVEFDSNPIVQVGRLTTCQLSQSFNLTDLNPGAYL